MSDENLMITGSGSVILYFFREQIDESIIDGPNYKNKSWEIFVISWKTLNAKIWKIEVKKWKDSKWNWLFGSMILDKCEKNIEACFKCEKIW